MISISIKLKAYTARERKGKRQPYNDVICKCPSSKQLYNVSNELLGKTKQKQKQTKNKKQKQPPPPPNQPTKQANKQKTTSQYPIRSPPVIWLIHCVSFSTTVGQIRNDINTQSAHPPVFVSFTGSEFCDCEPVIEVAILRLILNTTSKSCKLDPIPTPFIKQFFDTLVPVIKLRL